MSEGFRWELDERLVYRVSEAARMLGCDIARIYRHIKEGSLLAIDIRPPGAPKATYRITKSSLEAFLAAAQVVPTQVVAQR